ncbi:MAG: Maf family protein [Congregibacter sp.]
MRLLLGSASPRRAQLLRQLGADFEQRSADIDESVLPGEHPEDYVARLAREKSQALMSADTVLLTADTTVAIDELIMGKPENPADARRILKLLSGVTHRVYTGLCVAATVDGECRTHAAVVTTEVDFIVLPDTLIDDYLATDEPWDKAGAYAIQRLGGSFVRRIRGSVSNVIGLPLVETRELLEHAGLPMTVGKASDGDTDKAYGPKATVKM